MVRRKSGATLLAAFCGLCALGGWAAPMHAAAPTALDSLTLRNAEALLLQRNHELHLAGRAVDSAEADIVSARARPNSVLSVGSSSISPASGIGSGSVLDKRADSVIGLSQVFERGNKRELRTGAAEFNAAAARDDRAEVERQQRIALAGAYYDLVLAQERLRITGDTARLFGETLDAGGRRLKAGDISATELARISVDALRAQNDARAALAERDRAQLGVGYLVGAEREARRIVAVDGWPEPEAIGDDPDPERIVADRADVRAAQARVGAAEKNRDLALALRTRDITAGLQYERFPGSSPVNSYGFVFSVPLFTGNYYEGEIRRAESEFEASRENLDRVRGLALSEIARTRTDVRSAADRARRFREVLLAAAEKAAAGAEFAYSRGAIGVMDLLDARRQLYAARLEAAAVQSEYAKALAAWRASVAAAAALTR